MENFSREIIDLICEDWSDDEELVMKALFYLYNTSNDDKMRSQIVDIFNDYNYCIECGSKLKERIVEEVHTELEERPIEKIKEWYCQNCEK